uniref:Uncharacterized protein n=1 Tax=Polytomella parva TaxID=51329 RepID=A0A7S0UVC6_9CHLO|mmetsp:Transcript_23426/g.41644  ORF Transcript_23426/g.41644 Transcript_23426/m.41644 type:complete len:206 (+) Transcript_23426:529-1146(+)
MDRGSSVILELGGGVGLVSAVASLLWPALICTDLHDEALRLAQENVCNARLHRDLIPFNHSAVQPESNPVTFRHLDWMDFGAYHPKTDPDDKVNPHSSAYRPSEHLRKRVKMEVQSDLPHSLPSEAFIDALLIPTPSRNTYNSNCGSDFTWKPPDLAAIAAVNLIVAADVIYDETLTDSFCRCAAALLDYCSKKRQGEQGTFSTC